MIKALIVDAWHRGLRSPRQMDEMLAFATQCGFTDIYLQVRRAGDAFYTSQIVSRPALNEEGKTFFKPEDFDPLAYAIEHKGSLKIHAYLTMMQYETAGLFLDKELPYPEEWFMKDHSGIYWFNPRVEGARQHMIDIVHEVVNNYAIDGIFLEKLRYPGRRIGDGSWMEKTTAIRTLIEKIGADVRSLKPDLPITLCVHGDGTTYAHNVSRDLVNWRELKSRNVIDYAAIMVFKPAEKESEFLEWLSLLKPDYEILVIGNYRLPLSSVATRKSDADAFHTAYYSYANFSSCDGTRDDFKEVICQP